jgi:uncharacterized membrane protein
MAHSTRYYPNGSGSVVQIMGHPLHPMIVPLPIAALLGVFAADLMQVSTGDAFWARLGFTLLGAGLVTGFAAALLGIIEAASLQRARTSGTLWAHGAGNVVVMIASVANFKIRWEATDLWSPNLIYLSGFVACLLLVTGWLGGSLSYKHGIGVSERVGAARLDGDPDRTPDGRLDVAHER